MKFPLIQRGTITVGSPDYSPQAKESGDKLPKLSAFFDSNVARSRPVVQAGLTFPFILFWITMSLLEASPPASDSTARGQRFARILPLAFITYSLAYLDRVNIGFGEAGS